MGVGHFKWGKKAHVILICVLKPHICGTFGPTSSEQPTSVDMTCAAVDIFISLSNVGIPVPTMFATHWY